MEVLIPVLYDALAVVILIVAVSRSSEKGFAATVTNIVGHVAAFFGALFVGKAGSQLIYSLFIQKKVLRFLKENLAGAIDIGDIADSLQSAADSLPGMVGNFFRLPALEQLEDQLGSSVSNAAVALEQGIIAPAITGFIHILLFLISFIAFCFLARYLSKAVGLAFSLPIIRTADRFLGGVLGLVQGGINLYLIALVARFVLYFVQDPPSFFNEAVIMDTYLWSWIYLFNPFSFLK